MRGSAALLCAACAFTCLPPAAASPSLAFSLPASLPRVAALRHRSLAPGSLRLSAAEGRGENAGGEEDSVVVRRQPKEEGSPKEGGTSLKEIMETPGSMRVTRSKISAADMAAMQADAAAADPTVADARRRNLALAIASPLLGGGLYAFNKQRPVDPLALLRRMEAASPTLEAALGNGRPTVIEFYAEWCRDCKEMAPQMAALEQQYAAMDVNFVVLDAEKKENEKLVGLMQVDAIPQFTFLGRDKQVLTTLYGNFPPRVMEGQMRALAEGTQLPFCGADKCYLKEEDLVNAKKGDRKEL